MKKYGISIRLAQMQDGLNGVKPSRMAQMMMLGFARRSPICYLPNLD